MRITTAATALAAFAFAFVHADEEDAASTPSCTTPAAGAVDESMSHDVVWTRLAGYHDYYASTPKTEVAISLRHLVHSAGWNCFRWDVELLLPDGVSMRGVGASSSSTENGRDDVVRFEVTLEHVGCESGESDCEIGWKETHHDRERHEYQGAFRVTLWPDSANTSVKHGAPAAGGGRGEHWRYPVTFVADRN